MSLTVCRTFVRRNCVLRASLVNYDTHPNYSPELVSQSAHFPQTHHDHRVLRQLCILDRNGLFMHFSSYFDNISLRRHLKL